MKVLIPVKRVIDYTVKIKVRPEAACVEKKTVRMSMNPFCEIAVEEAVRLKEKNIVSEIVAVSIGGKKCVDQLRTAMAMGVDRSIHVLTDMETDSQLQPLAVSRILAKIVEKENPQLVILGKQAIDDDCNQTGQMLAGRLQWPQATFASKIEFTNDNKTIEVLREVDGGAQKVSMDLPALVSADLRLNEPRFATLQNIMKARKKQLEEIKLEDMGVDVKPELDIVAMTEPDGREGGVFVNSVDELFDKLKEHGFVK